MIISSNSPLSHLCTYCMHLIFISMCQYETRIVFNAKFVNEHIVWLYVTSASEFVCRKMSICVMHGKYLMWSCISVGTFVCSLTFN